MKYTSQRDLLRDAYGVRYPTIPRYLWEYQPRPRLRLFARPADEVADLQLLSDVAHGPLGRHRYAESALAALFLHAVIFALFVSGPALPRATEQTAIALQLDRPTPLIAPSPELIAELTSPAGSRTGLTLEELELRNQPNEPSAAETSPTPFVLIPLPEPAQPADSIAEPPEIEPVERSVVPQLPEGFGTETPEATPAPESTGPRLAFENPGDYFVSSSSATDRSSDEMAPVIPRPSTSVESAVQQIVAAGGAPGSTIVGDIPTSSGSFEARDASPSPSNTASNLQILSDPKGIDFRPYLIRVLTAVRHNWFAVMPGSVRLGLSGRTVIQFSVARSGSVPKLVIAVPSGSDPLDRAAVASISASNPFPPLPDEFTGDEIRLQLNFLYNMN